MNIIIYLFLADYSTSLAYEYDILNQQCIIDASNATV